MARQDIFCDMTTHFANGNIDEKQSGSRRGKATLIRMVVNTDTDGQAKISFGYDRKTKKVKMSFDEEFKRWLNQSGYTIVEKK